MTFKILTPEEAAKFSRLTPEEFVQLAFDLKECVNNSPEPELTVSAIKNDCSVDTKGICKRKRPS